MSTMHDIANKVGVSQSTVSRVLAGGAASRAISEETRAKILEAALELGYRIDPVARAMRGKSTHVIGMIARVLDSVFLPRLASELAKNFRQKGYDFIVTAAANDPNETLRLQTLFETQFCDGLVLAADPFGLSEAQLNSFFNKHLVMTAWGSPIADIPMVNTNNMEGIRQAMRHLLGLGHQRIGFLDVGWSGDTMLRRQAYIESMNVAGLAYAPYIISEVEGMPDGYRATTRLLELAEPPTAILAAEDFLALGALKAAYDKGRRVPQELSIVGFDDLPYAEFSVPALTTIRQPVGQIAEHTCHLLLRLINGETVPAAERQIMVQPELIIRESTAPPYA
ncbi:MAG: LacI family DNA-binding transcriptional regulator [Anaerolineae bacterium]|nr:LacI family DNA-binding transcriptional regulator [Anaerolineae bacterium]